VAGMTPLGVQPVRYAIALRVVVRSTVIGEA
jgi:hypothetical protein